MLESTLIPSPSRWDEPFDSAMTDALVADVLGHAPFSDIDPGEFSEPLTLNAILKYDARVIEVDAGGIVIRQGDFGTSVFFVLDGSLRVAEDEHESIETIGVEESPRRGFLGALAQLWTNHDVQEFRDLEDKELPTALSAAESDDAPQRLYFTDLEEVNRRYRSGAVIYSGNVFGEISALDRSPRTATVYAEVKTRLVEMRWQGFRDILKRNAGLRTKVDTLYRERSVTVHLHASPLFKHLSAAELNKVAEKTLFESYGDYDWHLAFNRDSDANTPYSFDLEPLIAGEGHYVDGLIIFTAGFGRTSVRVDHGHHTLSYLGRGDTFGLEEICHNWRNPKEPMCSSQRSLGAIGYAHVLRVPTSVVETYVLSRLDESALPGPLSGNPKSYSALADKRGEGVDQAMLEFLVERRFINGTATMVIDLDRCTRCDDCVRACAAGHDNNPRFIRHGPVFDHFMVANACMQCSDPVCMIGCPTGAIHRRTDEGQVVIDDATCIGCATCANSCPYDAIRMVRIRDRYNTQVLNQKTFTPVLKATKCDLCAEQMAGIVPACQSACPHDALVRIDMHKESRLAAWLNR